MSDEKTGKADENQAISELAHALPRLSADQIAEVSPKFVRHAFSAGEEIIKQGDPPERFYVVIRGHAEIWHEDSDGNWKHVDQRQVGEYFGEIGLLQDRPRTASVRASANEGVEVLALDHDHFKEMLDESRATEAHVARDMIGRLIQLADAQS